MVQPYHAEPASVRWPAVVGAIALVVAGGGLLGGLQDFMAPAMHRVHVQILDEIAEPRVEAEPGAPTHGEVPPDAVRAFRKVSHVPNWFNAWSMLSGSVRLLLAVVYSCAAVLLLLRRYAAVPVLIVTASAAIVWNVVRCIVALRLGEAFSWMTAPSAIVGSVVHLALIVAVVWGMRSSVRGGLR